MNNISQQLCVVIPTYNNDRTLRSVIDGVLSHVDNVIVVNDGSTDSTSDILSTYGDCLVVVEYDRNRGKGYAIRRGMSKAMEIGYRYMITFDADGQHFAKDINTVISYAEKNPDVLIVGSRAFTNDNMPTKNVFANRFSNFWFTLQTGYRLNDTQTGFRLYPLKKMKSVRNITNRYEAELELLVRSAWAGIRLMEVPISVHYPSPEERVSHFRPFKDFFRISLLNTVFVFMAIAYGYPSMLINKLKSKR